jgi:hypothetical protein
VDASTRFQQWLPAESFADGKQADVRLDRPVRFWRAGVTLSDLFVDLTRQTGVTLRFSPPEDENRRICLNIFLNEKQPPSLREVMAQISWTVDCSFSISQEEGRQVYRLLSTDVGQAAKASAEQRHEERAQGRVRLYSEIDKKLDEYRSALELSRDALIAKYRGKDDLLLLNLLDPALRAATRMACRHLTQSRPDDWQQAVDIDCVARGYFIPEQGLAPEDCSDLQAFRGEASPWVRIVTTLLQNASAQVVVQASAGANPAELPVLARSPDPAIQVTIVSLPPSGRLSGRDEVRLRKCLGQPVPPEEEAGFVKEWDASRKAAQEAKRRDEIERGRALSAEAKARLSGLVSRLTGTTDCAQWQWLEELAKASGYHVISDAFTTGGPAVPVETKEGEPGIPLMSGLDALTDPGPGGAFYLRNPFWEWGDAGTFLRFRSTNRDLFRGALLPEEFLTWMDRLIRPYLPRDTEARTADFVLPLDLHEWIQHMATLPEPAFRLGAEVSRAAPDDLAGNARHAVLEAVWGSVQPELIRFLGVLNDKQWTLLQGPGLTAPGDLFSDQSGFLNAWLRVGRGSNVPADFSHLTITCASQEGPEGKEWRVATWFWRDGSADSGGVTMPGEGESGPSGSLPAEVRVHVDLSAYEAGPRQHAGTPVTTP